MRVINWFVQQNEIFCGDKTKLQTVNKTHMPAKRQNIMYQYKTNLYTMLYIQNSISNRNAITYKNT